MRRRRPSKLTSEPGDLYQTRRLSEGREIPRGDGGLGAMVVARVMRLKLSAGQGHVR